MITARWKVRLYAGEDRTQEGEAVDFDLALLYRSVVSRCPHDSEF